MNKSHILNDDRLLRKGILVSLIRLLILWMILLINRWICLLIGLLHIVGIWLLAHIISIRLGHREGILIGISRYNNSSAINSIRIHHIHLCLSPPPNTNGDNNNNKHNNPPGYTSSQTTHIDCSLWIISIIIIKAVFITIWIVITI